MSEDALQKLIERFNTDPDFAAKLQANWVEVAAEYDLSDEELMALGNGDEDALRRLAGAEVSGHWPGVTAWCVTAYCQPANTPGSGKHCGTGQCQGTPGSGQGCGTGGNCTVKQ